MLPLGTNKTEWFNPRGAFETGMLVALLGAMMVLKQSRPVFKVKFLREEMASWRGVTRRTRAWRGAEDATLGRRLGHRGNEMETVFIKRGLAVLASYLTLAKTL